MTNRIDLIRPDAPALAVRGSHRVGVRTLALDCTVDPDLAPRHLTVEVWYPAATDTAPGTAYGTILRDGITPVVYHGSACRDAAPAQDLRAPLVVLSHGYPGNRYLMAHLAESLAAKGFFVAAPDHAGSTYEDQQPFGQTLLYRPLDQRGVIDAMARHKGDLSGLVDCARVAVIGYSMGGYGALVLGGAGLSAAALRHERAPQDGTLARHRAGTPAHAALADARLKAVIAIGPWGGAADFWDDEGLGGLAVPMLLMAGTQDDISGYAAMRRIAQGAAGVARHLLSFQQAGHNAAAPVPAPAEAWMPLNAEGWSPFSHYADPVWDTVQMNNIAQHFAAAFLATHLQGTDQTAEMTALPGVTLEHFAAGQAAP